MEIFCNGQPRDIHDGASIAELLAALERPARQVAVEVNLELIPRERHADFTLHAGDRVEVVTLAGGG